MGEDEGLPSYRPRPISSDLMAWKSNQAIVHVEEDLFEAQRTRGRLASPVKLDDVVLCLHAPMDARTNPIV